MNLCGNPLLLLIIKPYIKNYKVGRNLIDSGSDLNLLFEITVAHFAYSILKVPDPHVSMTIHRIVRVLSLVI